MSRATLRLFCAAVGWLLSAVPVFAQQIVIWHDKGDDGAKMLQQMAEVFAKDHPGFSIRSVSMPTDQWFSRSIAALNTNTAPDILFNDGFRLVQVQQQTRKLSDLAAQLNELAPDDRKVISDGDIAA